MLLNSLRRNWMLEQPLLFTLLGETGCLSNLYYLLAARASSFSNHSLSYHSLCSTCVIYETRHWSPSTSHPTIPGEAEDLARGGKYPKDMPVPTFLAYLQPV